MLDYFCRKFMECVEKNNHIPKYMNIYNASEIVDYSPSLTTNCGNSTGSSTTIIFEVVKDE